MNLKEKILALKKEKNAVILAHNYQRPEIWEVSDYIGDSFGLSVAAAKTDAKIILFAGVDFMAETAAILNPGKKVLIPNRDAKCPMAEMLKAKTVAKYRKMYPNAAIAVYINTCAETKALADVVVTSSNAVEICRKIEKRQILFGPDRNLALYVQKCLPQKEIIPMPENGYCHVHKNMELLDIGFDKIDASTEILAHPECNMEIQESADFVGSTEKMFERPKISGAKSFVVGTEIGLIQRMQKAYPDKNIYPLNKNAICFNMKKNTLDLVYDALMHEKNVVSVKKDIADKARIAIENMLHLSGAAVMQKIIVKQ